MSGEKKQRYVLTIEGNLATFWDNGKTISHSKVEHRLNALTDERDMLAGQLNCATTQARENWQQVEALTVRVEELEAAERTLRTVWDFFIVGEEEEGKRILGAFMDDLAQRSEGGNDER